MLGQATCLLKQTQPAEALKIIDQVIEQVAFPERLRGWTVLVVGGAITFVLADVVRRLIEQPMIARGRRIAARTASPGQSIATT